MLGFTGVELLVIVATSIVQMYCIKNLIGNELIIWNWFEINNGDKLVTMFLCK